MRIIEARCGLCGEGFVPADDSDTVHIAREDGSECGGLGVILGEWRPLSEYLGQPGAWAV